MAKITFRASEDLVERLESFEESKSEILREALRSYLDGRPPDRSAEATLDQLISERVDDLIEERLDNEGRRPRDVNVNITLEGDLAGAAKGTAVRKTDEPERETGAVQDQPDGPPPRDRCGQCGESLSGGQVYCPNCGKKTARRIFCECGDELRSDWSFCPTCGRRTPAADVLEGS